MYFGPGPSSKDESTDMYFGPGPSSKAESTDELNWNNLQYELRRL